MVEGDFSFQIEGEPVKQLKAGEAAYLRPNVVHRGMNKSDKPVELFVVRIKPKDAPWWWRCLPHRNDRQTCLRQSA